MSKYTLLILLLVFVSLSIAQEGSYSYFNFFSAYPSQGGYYGDGFHFSGPFRANGAVNLYSATPGRDNDPYFYSFTLSSDYYIYGGTSSGPHVTVPQYENLWIEPYEQMLEGPPYFNLGAEPLPFGADEVEWQITRAAAVNYGLYLTSTEVPDGSRILLDDTLLMVKIDESTAPEFYPIYNLAEPVIWIENAPSDILYLKANPGASEISEELTIGCSGDIFISGPLEYSTDSPGMLGLISVYGDGVIADTPTSDWVVPFDIETEESFAFSASVLLLEGCLKAENPTEPTPMIDFILFGGAQFQSEGYTSASGSGFSVTYDYDTRLFNQSPPWYPEYQTFGIESAEQSAINLELLASANPFSSTVLLTSSHTGKISVFDSAGRVIEEVSSVSHHQFNASSLPDGLYMAVVTDTEGNRAFLKLVKF